MIVLFSGCDSGFGFEVAKHLTKLGFKVFAGCLRKKQGGPGVKELVSLYKWFPTGMPDKWLQAAANFII